jgi:hypothetical protein
MLGKRKQADNRNGRSRASKWHLGRKLSIANPIHDNWIC